MDIAQEMEALKMQDIFRGGLDAAQQMQYQREVEMPEQEHLAKMASAAMRAESVRISQETQNFQLEELRRKAKNEAEAHQMIPDFVDAQLGLANDPSKDPFEKSQGIAAIYAQLPPSALRTSRRISSRDFNWLKTISARQKTRKSWRLMLSPVTSRHLKRW
jgi:hypothetical protein